MFTLSGSTQFKNRLVTMTDIQLQHDVDPNSVSPSCDEVRIVDDNVNEVELSTVSVGDQVIDKRRRKRVKIISPECAKLLDLLVESGTQQENKEKAMRTAKQNVNRVAHLHRLIFGCEWDYTNYNWCKETSMISTFIFHRNNWSTVKSKNNQYTSLASILRRFKDDPELGEVYTFYSNRVTEHNKIIKEALKENADNGRTYIPWEDVLKIQPVCNLDLLLFKLYTTIPPRRSEYKSLVRITEKSYDSIETKNLNYLIEDSVTGVPVAIAINDYKEGPKRRYGSVKIELDYELASLFRTVIEDRSVEIGERIFTDYCFSQPIQRIFGMGVNGIRHSFASWFLDGTRTMKEKELVAKRMGTSVTQLELSYFKVTIAKKRRCATCRVCRICGPGATGDAYDYSNLTGEDDDGCDREHLTPPNKKIKITFPKAESAPTGDNDNKDKMLQVIEDHESDHEAAPEFFGGE